MTYKITEFFALTNETIERDASADEIAQIEKDQNAEAKRKADAIAEAQAKATAKEALLDRLGITADEAKLLLS